MASKQFHERAKKSRARIPHYARNSMVPHDSPHHDSQVIMAQKHALEGHSWKRWFSLNPQQTGNTTLFRADDNTMTFQINPSDRHITHCYLEITATVSNASVTFAPSYLWYKFVEVKELFCFI